MTLQTAGLPIVAALLALGGCSGYQLGGTKPSHLAEVRTIEVHVVENETQMPRASAHATNSLVDAITRDGTYLLATTDRADARLAVVLSEINYRQARSTRTDTLRSEELEMTITMQWSLVDAKNPLRVLHRGRSKGTTRFFVDPNLPTARQTALVDALKRASEGVVATLADGF